MTFWLYFGGGHLGGNSGYYDHFTTVEIKTPHTNNSIRVRAGSRVNEGSTNESFGIDNVEIWVR